MSYITSSKYMGGATKRVVVSLGQEFFNWYSAHTHKIKMTYAGIGSW